MPQGNICLDRNLLFDFKKQQRYTYPPSKPRQLVARPNLFGQFSDCPGGARKLGDSAEWKIAPTRVGPSPESRGRV